MAYTPTKADRRKAKEMNRDRIGWAEVALDAFAEETFSKDFATAFDDGEGDDVIADLLCNLRHLAKARGLDFADLDRRGAANFEHEDAPDYAGD